MILFQILEEQATLYLVLVHFSQYDYQYFYFVKNTSMFIFSKLYLQQIIITSFHFNGIGIYKNFPIADSRKVSCLFAR